MQTRSQTHNARPGASSCKASLHKTARRVKQLGQRNSLCGHTGNKVQVFKPRKPPKFSWVVEGLLAAHGRPAQPGHLQYLQNQGIQVLVTLTENKPRALTQYSAGFEWKHIPVKDEKPPSVDQAREFVSIVKESDRLGQRVSVHCAWGRGRTGTMLACYLGRVEGLSASAAISRVRLLRTGSVDNVEQEQTVRNYLATPNT